MATSQLTLEVKGRKEK